MLDLLRPVLKRPLVIACLWAVVVTLAMAWPIVAPPVTPQGVAFREDTAGVEMFEMSGANYAAIVGAVGQGRLVATDLQDGFKAFTPPRLSKQQLAGRVKVARDVVGRSIAASRAAARWPLLAIWAALALLLPAIALGIMAFARKPQPLTAPPVRPEMM
jgi:hypothetical protein